MEQRSEARPGVRARGGVTVYSALMVQAATVVRAIELAPVCACTAVSPTVQLVFAAQGPIPPSKPAFCPVRKFPPSWNWSPTLTFAASAAVIWMLVVELVPCPIPAHPCARFSASPDLL